MRRNAWSEAGATTLLAAAIAVLAQASPASADDAASPAPPSPPGSDRVEARSPHDVEMLRRLLDMTLRAQPPSAGDPPQPLDGAKEPAAAETAMGT